MMSIELRLLSILGPVRGKGVGIDREIIMYEVFSIPPKFHFSCLET